MFSGAESSDYGGVVDSDDENEDEITAKMEGYLYKITKSKKVKKLWFRMVNKDLYCK